MTHSYHPPTDPGGHAERFTSRELGALGRSQHDQRTAEDFTADLAAQADRDIARHGRRPSMGRVRMSLGDRGDQPREWTPAEQAAHRAELQVALDNHAIDPDPSEDEQPSP